MANSTPPIAKKTVPANGILCILTPRDKPAILQAELDGAPLLPQQPINFPPVVNPQIIDGSSVGNIFKIQSFNLMSTKADDRGPVYLKGEQGRCGTQQANDVSFEFQEANAGQLFHWETPRIQDPNDPGFWDARPDEICFVKALVTGSKPDSVIYVKSTGKAQGSPDVDYGYTAEKSAMVGAQGVVCLEYRCNEGPQAPYQTHLQFLTLTGTCTFQGTNTVQGLNSVLDGQQSQCGVRQAVPPVASETSVCQVTWWEETLGCTRVIQVWPRTGASLETTSTIQDDPLPQM
ncbi:hypothetical protein OS493_035865 [Desmophyllum pertusum]|uniref:Uncharacterized protein n=1 Tax=Desmophyllum pertusum TaxID=174260 RepID=A0A9X0D6M2_9CNID|nr:hypothetical protein OS493_035865 [Desmophyllum pertusum]